MQLTIPQRRDLEDALRIDFTPATLGNMLSSQLNRKLHDIINPVGSSYPNILDKVIGTAEDEGWTWDLIRGALTANPLGPNLQSFIAKYPVYNPANPPPPPIDYYEAYVVLADSIFIDRKDLRTALKKLDLQNGPRVLVVTGERFTGKTYTRELIFYLANNLPNSKAIYIDLDKYVFEPNDLVESIGRQMSRDISTIPQQTDEQKARWVQKLSDWVVAQVSNPGTTTYWLVLDGFLQQTLLTETKDLIEELAIRAQSTARQCRVVLLNYNESLPIQINDSISRETINSIEHDELMRFFEQWNTDHGQKYTSQYLSDKVDVILREVNQAIARSSNGKSERLQLLRKAVSGTVKLLFS